MVNGGIQSLTPSPHNHPEPERKPNQPSCSQRAGLGDGSLKRQVKAIPAPSALPTNRHVPWWVWKGEKGAIGMPGMQTNNEAAERLAQVSLADDGGCV